MTITGPCPEKSPRIVQSEQFTPPSDDQEKSGTRPRNEKQKIYRRNLLPNSKMEEHINLVSYENNQMPFVWICDERR